MDFDLVAFVIIAMVVTLTPGFIALARNHRNAGAIAVLCVVLGWTGIGWLIALVWAFTNNVEQPA